MAHTGAPEKRGSRLARLQTFSSLKYRDFRLLWFSTLFASAGNWIQQITLGWLMYEMTSSAFLVGALHGTRTLPFLLAGPIGGVLSDRMDRRRLLISTQIMLALLALAFAFLILFDLLRVWHFFVFTFLSGVGWAVNHPVRQALVANTVPRHELLNAVVLITSAFNVNRVIGPAVGGLLIAFFGPGNNFLLQAVCFAMVVVVVLPMRVQQQNEEERSRRVSTLSSFREGIDYVLKEQTILALILLTIIPSIFLMPFTTGLMPVFAKDVLGVGPDGLGILYSGFGAGALLGPMILVSAGDVQRKGWLVLATGVFSALGVIAFSQAAYMPVAIVVIAWVGAAQMLFHTLINTVLQTITPDAFRGRVMSLYMMDHGLVPLGSLIAGVLAQFYGSSLAILTGGTIGTVLILIASVRLRAIRTMV